MRTTIQLFSLALAMVFVFSSCVSKKKYTEMMDNKMSTEEVLEITQQKMRDMEEKIKTLESEKEALASEYEQSTEKWIAKMTKMEASLKSCEETATKEISEKESAKSQLLTEIRNVFSPYEGNGMTLVEKNGRFHISISSPITYRSGSSRLGKEHYPTIENLAAMLQNNPRMQIMVEGHTDSVPMKSDARYSSNMELSYARANGVVDQMIKFGADANQLTSIGRGATRPSVEDEANPDLRHLNRRTEFIIIPDVSGLYRLGMTSDS